MLNLLKVARLQFAVIGAALFLFGALWAVLLGAPFSVLRLLSGYLILFTAQLSVHFSNDYFDVDSDRLGGTTLVSGGAGILQVHAELKEPVRRIAIVLILFSLLWSSLFIWVYSMPLWTMGFVLLGNLIGWVYSAPPFRLSARGLGETASAVTIGFLIPAMGYLVMSGTLDLFGIYFIIPLTAYGLVLILTVETPDMEDDRLAGKMTWVARWGRVFAFSSIGWLLIAATVYFFIFPRFSERQIPLDMNVLGVLSLLPLVLGILGMLKKPVKREPSVKIATGIIMSLGIFAICADGYLFILLTR